MDAALFADSPFGAPAREPGNKYAFTYYLPRSLPRQLDVSPAVVEAMSDADAALGMLQGLSVLMHDPELLIGPSIKREAVASSRIEGTQASLSDVLQAEVGDRSASNDDVREVEQYLEATRLAYELAKKLPITQRLLLHVHAVLLTGVRGQEKSPGEFRTSPVWVGSVGDTPDTAAYVPPIPAHLPELMSDWEKFVNEDGRRLPVLLQAALMHYQFETIHPFRDGNGRIGRLVINLLLMDRGRLDQPLLYISHYFESHRSAYYEALQGVRERGDIDTWLRFFLEAVKEQANDAVARSRRLIGIREEYLKEAVKGRSSLPQLVEQIVQNPYITVKYFAQTADLTEQGARTVIRRAANKGWLRRMGIRGQGGREYWYAPEVVAALEEPMVYSG